MFKSRIQVLNHGIQDSCTIDYVVCLSKSSWKSCLFHFLSVLTLGFFWLLGYWSAKLKSRLVFVECSVDEATHFIVYNWDSKWSIIEREDMLVLVSKNAYKQSITFTNRHIRYFYDEIKEVFQSFKYDTAKKLNELREGEVNVYPQSQRDKLHKQFGRCLVEIKIDSLLMLFLKQILSPYEVFQLYAIIYWLTTGYYIFPIILLIASIFTYIYDVRLLGQGQLKLRADSLIATVVSYVVKNQSNEMQLQKEHSEILVPGDMFFLGQKQIVPCDCIILKGSGFINEQYMSGNSIPIRKSEVPNFQYDDKKQNDSTLYMGTEIICIQHQTIKNRIQLPTPEYKSILCLAIRTNYSCFRGQYLRSILYPKRHAFKFFNQSLSFIVIMFFINILGFLAIIYKVREFLHTSHGIILFLDLLTTAIPPTLPTAMSVGIGFAMRRLSAMDIRCMVKQKILVGGRIDTMMIEGSNLVSKSQINVLGFIPNNPGDNMMLKFLKKGELKSHKQALQGMVSTLATSRCEYDGKYLGSMYDIQILQFIGGAIDTDNITLKLDNTLIIVQDKKYSENWIETCVLIDDRKYKFVRGTWDKVTSLCRQAELSTNIQEIVDQLTVSGFQIFALAYCQLLQNENADAQQTRLEFLGLVVIEQKQQFKSGHIIQTLKSAHIHSVVLSRQNSTNSIKTAIKSNIAFVNKDIMYCQLVKHLNGENKIYKSYPQYKNNRLQEQQQQVSTIVSTEDEITKDFVFGVDEHRPIQICMNANLFQELHTRKSISSIRHILQKTVVFCNLQQRHYKMIVESYQQLGRLVSIVGDNVRDNAFKQADIGLALTSSDLEALSHFSARRSNIDAIVNLLIVAKASLSCNFQMFKMMCLFSLTQFTTYVVLYMNYQQLNNAQNLYIDLIIMCPIFICLSLTEPCSKLSKQKPPASLFSLSNVLSMTGLFIIQLISQFAIVYCMRSRKYLLEYEEDSLKYILQTDSFNQDTYQATNLFVFSNFLYIGIALATSVSRPFRKQFYTNIPLVITIIALWVYNVLIPFDFMVPQSMQIKHLHSNWIIVIILAANSVCLVMYLYENLILSLVRKLRRKYKLE